MLTSWSKIKGKIDVDKFARIYFGEDKENKEYIDAFEYLDIELPKDSPEEAWRLIIELLPKAKTQNDLGSLGAGPLEIMLWHHGSKFIDRIEIEAKRNKYFAYTVCNASPDHASKDVEDRIMKLWKLYKDIKIDLPEG